MIWIILQPGIISMLFGLIGCAGLSSFVRISKGLLLPVAIS